MKELPIKDFAKHPCFNVKAKGSYGRVHLPVAPKCNIKCNFCDRKYDCVNESRPGVTSSVLTPDQAEVYMDRVVEKEPRISVAGIAGPGDPFANGAETIATMRKIKKNHPETILCLSSNGMGIGPYIKTIAEIGVSHVTITVCAVDPEIGSRIYSWVKDGKVVYRGIQAAQLLLTRQKAAIQKLKEYGILVKVNCIVIPGINDQHVVEVAKELKQYGVDLFNAIAIFPNVNTPFGHIEQPSKEYMSKIRAEAEKYLPQMRHCTRCRADAVGLLDDDKSNEFRGCLSACSSLAPKPAGERTYVAVASQEGILINQHLGEAKSFSIWEEDGNGYNKVEERKAPESVGGIKRWHMLAKTLGDCRAVLISGIGETPFDILSKSGITPVVAAGFVEEGLRAVYDNRSTDVLRGRRQPCSEKKCAGSGDGCN